MRSDISPPALRPLLLALLTPALLLIACETSGGPANTDPTPAADMAVDGEAPAAQVTWHGEVRPLVARYCAGCHADGELGPFPLETYEQARPWAAPMAMAVRARTMPPFLADDSGHCQTFRDSSWLTDEQIALFEAWADAGAPEGDSSIPAPAPRALPTLEGRVEVVDTGADYLPDQSRPDDYRCFVVDSPGAFAATGFDVVPSNPRIAHHLIAYQAIDAEAAAAARALDAQDDTPGYPCLGTGPQVNARNIAGWAPGAGATLFPAGTGVELDGALPLIIEMHYNTVGGPGETDRTALHLQTVESGSVTPLLEVGVLDYDFEGPPGDPAWSTTDYMPVQWSLWDYVPDYQGRVLLHGINGHMHTRGLSMRIGVSGSVDACLLDMPRWDWNWQQSYWFEEPIEIDAADLFDITCVFDTRGIDEPLVWGEGTGDEMCLGGLYVTLLD